MKNIQAQYSGLGRFDASYMLLCISFLCPSVLVMFLPVTRVGLFFFLSFSFFNDGTNMIISGAGRYPLERNRKRKRQEKLKGRLKELTAKKRQRSTAITWLKMKMVPSPADCLFDAGTIWHWIEENTLDQAALFRWSLGGMMSKLPAYSARVSWPDKRGYMRLGV